MVLLGENLNKLGLLLLTQTWNHLRIGRRPFTDTSMSSDLANLGVPTLGFGIEIEFDDVPGKSSDDIVQSLRKHGFEVDFKTYEEHVNASCTNQTSSTWTLTLDSTAYYEIVSPVLKSLEGLIEVKKMCESLQGIGARCSESCGLHVHVDASNLTDATRAQLLLSYHSLEEEHGLLDCFEACREVSTYCTKAAFETLQKACRGRITFDESTKQGRYHALNFLTKNGTVEFRRYHGTTCFREVLSWIILCLFMVSNPASISREGNNLSHAFVNLGMLGSDILPQWAASVLLQRQGFGAKLRLLKYLRWPDLLERRHIADKLEIFKGVVKEEVDESVQKALQDDIGVVSDVARSVFQRASAEVHSSNKTYTEDRCRVVRPKHEEVVRIGRRVNAEHQFVELIEEDWRRITSGEVRLVLNKISSNRAALKAFDECISASLERGIFWPFQLTPVLESAKKAAQGVFEEAVRPRFRKVDPEDVQLIKEKNAPVVFKEAYWNISDGQMQSVSSESKFLELICLKAFEECRLASYHDLEQYINRSSKRLWIQHGWDPPEWRRPR